jgi:hypothetical protein
VKEKTFLKKFNEYKKKIKNQKTRKEKQEKISLPKKKTLKTKK